MIPQRDLSLLSNRLAKAGGRRVPDAVAERDYCMARFLAALSKERLGGVLAFKGGTALKRCSIGDSRFSEDLDFTLTEEAPLEDIRRRARRRASARSKRSRPGRRSRCRTERETSPAISTTSGA